MHHLITFTKSSIVRTFEGGHWTNVVFPLNKLFASLAEAKMRTKSVFVHALPTIKKN